jgi:hypothetical protein
VCLCLYMCVRVFVWVCVWVCVGGWGAEQQQKRTALGHNWKIVKKNSFSLSLSLTHTHTHTHTHIRMKKMHTILSLLAFFTQNSSLALF